MVFTNHHASNRRETMPKMKLTGLDLVKEMPFFKLYSAFYENSENGSIKQYDLVSRNKDLTAETLGRDLPTSAVAILPVDPENRRILLTREFRMPINDYVTAIPAGLLDPGEDIETAARRELKEETGCIADKIRIFPPTFSCIGLTDETASVAIATVAGFEDPEQEENEEITSAWYTYEEALEIMTSPETKTGARAQMLVLAWLMHEGLDIFT